MSEVYLTANNPELINKKSKLKIAVFILPLIIFILAIAGMFGNLNSKTNTPNKYLSSETKGKEIKNSGQYNILSSGDLSGKIKDTVYTDLDNWLELRINEQMVYQHWRDGRTIKYPVSTGNNKGGDPEALETRPGLFSIFLKVEHHQSSQFSAANMYNFMPFNQGIGFHSIDGTGYYAHLGVRPSSHGCIRMKHADVKQLFSDCPKGTLVLALKNYSARTVAFAPKDFKNKKEYSKDEYKIMLASNLYNLLNGKYYTEERERFIIDPKVIPVSGVYISYDNQIPDNQILPRSFLKFYEKKDDLMVSINSDKIEMIGEDEFIKLVSEDEEGNLEFSNNDNSKDVSSTEDLVKKYFYNPIGVLPYFGPKR